MRRSRNSRRSNEDENQNLSFSARMERRKKEFQQKEQQYQSTEFENQRALAVISQELTNARARLMRQDTTLDK